MLIKEFINDVSDEIKYKPIRKEISKELEIHIQEIKKEYVNKGIENQQAEIEAVLQMGEAKSIGRSLNKIHRPKLDWKLLVLLIFLMAFGIVASMLKQTLRDDYNYVSKTILYMTLGGGLGIGLYFLDYRKIKKYSNLLYAIATLVMFLPMINYNGDLSFKVFNIKFMPYVVSVPLYIVAFVGNIDNNKVLENKSIIKIVVLTILSLLMLSFMSFINTIILASIYLVILIPKMKKESSIKFLVSSIILYLVLITMFIISINGKIELDTGLLFEKENNNDKLVIEEIQEDILKSANLIGKSNTKEIMNSKSIIYNQSQYTLIALLGKLGILPVLIILLTILLITVRIIRNFKTINESYGKTLTIGLGMLYIIQAIINIFMNFNMGVKVDVNLPLITYGAAYYIVNICSMSVILSIYRRKDIIIDNVRQRGFIRKLGQLLIEVDKKLV